MKDHENDTGAQAKEAVVRLTLTVLLCTPRNEEFEISEHVFECPCPILISTGTTYAQSPNLLFFKTVRSVSVQLQVDLAK